MQGIKTIRGNGGIPATLAGEDHISGLVMYMADADIPSANAGVTGFSTTNRIIPISSIETAESLGIKYDAAKFAVKVLWYHISEALRINPAITLYVGIFTTPTLYDFTEIKTMQTFSGGKLRQIGVWAGDKALSANEITSLQAIGTLMDAKDTPLSILYQPKVADISAIGSSMAVTGQKNVSVLIGQDGDGTGSAIYLNALNTTNKYAVGILGLVLGCVSLAAVHEAISWVQKFPAGINTPGFVDGKLLKNIDSAVVESLDDKRFIFLTTYGGLAGSYINSSATMDVITSDYNYIERVRTMDKACRGIRTYLLPYLGSPMYIDADTGKLGADTIAILENVANQHLEAMQKAGELSGYVAYINPDQNVLASSTLEIVIKQVSVGVLRTIKLTIGFTNKIS